jgi:hypothetical protein
MLARRRLAVASLDALSFLQCCDRADAAIHAPVVDRAGVHDRGLDREPASLGSVNEPQRERLLSILRVRAIGRSVAAQTAAWTLVAVEAATLARRDC